MNNGMYSTVDMELSFTVVCAVCGSPLKARLDKSEITVALCTSCRDDANNDGYDKGYADGEASHQ